MINTIIGRPTKLNYKVMARLEDALENGATITQACAYANISRDAYYRYLNNEEIFAKRMGFARSRPRKIMIEAILFWHEM